MVKEPDWDRIREFLEPKPIPEGYCPHPPHPKQKAFLRSESLEVLFGGRASGGKSDALLMGALQYVDVPGYASIIFRNTYSDLSLPGALMERAHEWLDDTDAQWKDPRHTWVFPSGATLTFGYLERPLDHLRYKGMEAQYIGFDELTEIREKHYRYMFSRLRKPSGVGGLALARVPLRVRSASNPAPNWVRRYFIEEGKKHGRLYIPSGVKDNPSVDEASYKQALSRLDAVELARLDQGDWYAEESGTTFSRADFKVISPEEVPEVVRLSAVRYWDTAATVVSDRNKDPDWTAGALVGLDSTTGKIYILDMRRDRLDSAGVEDLIRRTANEDRQHIRIRMEQEPGASGKNMIDNYRKYLLQGFDFDGNTAVTNKAARVRTWAGRARRGEVFIVRGDWVTAFLDEAVAFDPDGKGQSGVHDDQLDAVSGAYEVLAGLGKPTKRKAQIIV